MSLIHVDDVGELTFVNIELPGITTLETQLETNMQTVEMLPDLSQDDKFSSELSDLDQRIAPLQTSTYMLSGKGQLCPEGYNRIQNMDECTAYAKLQQAAGNHLMESESVEIKHANMSKYMHGCLMKPGESFKTFYNTATHNKSNPGDEYSVCKRDVETKGRCFARVKECPHVPAWRPNHFKRDVHGEKHNNAGKDASKCLDVRRQDFASWCGTSIDNVIMRYIPPTAPVEE